MTDTETSDGDEPTEALASIPEGWQVWSQGEDGRLVLVYRPDIFDTEDLPPACLPTLYLTHGKRTRRPGVNPTSRDDDTDWYVTLYLEPDVSADTDRFPTRAAALERVAELAAAFDGGEIDYRELYQVPRADYFERLDELTGASDLESSSGRES